MSPLPRPPTGAGEALVEAVLAGEGVDREGAGHEGADPEGAGPEGAVLAAGEGLEAGADRARR